MQKLTDRQRMVLEYISQSIEQRGYPPTLREIGNHMGIRSTNGVNDHLRALERKGYLSREDMKSRALKPTQLAIASRIATANRIGGASHIPGASQIASHIPSASRMDGNGIAGNDRLMQVPIVGRVTAGQLSEALENPEDSVTVDRTLVGQGYELFGLRVRGDSMIEAGIHDGDFVFVRKQLEANRGSVVIALVGDEATCKYYFPEREHIRLQPANRQMAPILIPRNDWRSTSILGVVVGIYRKLDPS